MVDSNRTNHADNGSAMGTISITVNSNHLKVNITKIKPLKFIKTKKNKHILFTKKPGDNIGRNLKYKTGKPGKQYDKKWREKRQVQYDYDYDYGHNAEVAGGRNYEQNEKKDTYDIHGFKDKGEHLWIPGLTQPAYTVSTEGVGLASHGLNSGKPITFHANYKKRGNYVGPIPGPGVSSSNYNRRNKKNDEHHHHHYYDGLSHSHHGSQEIITDGPVRPHSSPMTIRQKGKHRHYHHIRPEPTSSVPIHSELALFDRHSNSKQNKPLKYDCNEEERYFDPSQMTQKELEDIYKTYDDEDIVSEIFDEDSEDSSARQTFSRSSLLKSLKNAKNKAKQDVDKIFKNVSKKLKKLDTSLENFSDFVPSFSEFDKFEMRKK